MTDDGNVDDMSKDLTDDGCDDDVIHSLDAPLNTMYWTH
jgi:hypothetical protein